MNVRHKPAESRQKLHLVDSLFITQVVLPSDLEDLLRRSGDVSEDAVVERVVRPLVNLKDEHVPEQSTVAPVPVTTPPQAVVHIAVVAPGDDFVLLPTLLALHSDHPLRRCCGLVHSRRSPLLGACRQSGRSHNSSGHMGQPRQRSAFGVSFRWAFP